MIFVNIHIIFITEKCILKLLKKLIFLVSKSIVEKKISNPFYLSVQNYRHLNPKYFFL